MGSDLRTDDGKLAETPTFLYILIHCVHHDVSWCGIHCHPVPFNVVIADLQFILQSALDISVRLFVYKAVCFESRLCVDTFQLSCPTIHVEKQHEFVF